jgi:hypothetical protein
MEIKNLTPAEGMVLVRIIETGWLNSTLSIADVVKTSSKELDPFFLKKKVFIVDNPNTVSIWIKEQGKDVLYMLVKEEDVKAFGEDGE